MARAPPPSRSFWPVKCPECAARLASIPARQVVEGCAAAEGRSKGSYASVGPIGDTGGKSGRRQARPQVEAARKCPECAARLASIPALRIGGGCAGGAEGRSRDSYASVGPVGDTEVSVAPSAPLRRSRPGNAPSVQRSFGSIWRGGWWKARGRGRGSIEGPVCLCRTCVGDTGGKSSRRCRHLQVETARKCPKCAAEACGSI